MESNRVEKKQKKKDKKQKKLKENRNLLNESNSNVVEEDPIDSMKETKKRKERSPSPERNYESEKKSKKSKKKKNKASSESPTSESSPPSKVIDNDDQVVKGEGPYQQPPSSDGKYVKSFYREASSVSKMTEEQLAEFHQENQMTITGNHCTYKPITNFNESGFSKDILKCCSGFSKPTPIQSQCWPILTSGRDIIGIAETGSGKTLAFSLPALVHIQDRKKKALSSSGKQTCMLVVAPTRELAMQSSEVIAAAGSNCGISSLCIFGGVPKHEQKKALRQGVDIIVATPGRLKDLLTEKSCHLDNVTYMVLDEADRMLDEGFEKDIRLIIQHVHPERQIAMFSATWPQSIQALAHEFLNDPVKVTIGSDDLAASKNVTQIVEVVEEYGRDTKVNHLLHKYHQSRKNRILVFVLYKKEAVRVERMLQKYGWNCVAIHGDKNQHDRIKAVESFKSGKIPLLIATDVAARGLDIPGVEYVINYSFPLTIEDYVHRIGRTGRGGKKGTSHTFFTNHDKPRAGELVNLLREAKQVVPDELTKFGTHVKKKEHKLYGAFAKNIDMSKKATKITFDD